MFLFGWHKIVPIVIFFFSSRRRHTRWTGDWSSDVCSSDLDPPEPPRRPEGPFLRHGPWALLARGDDPPEPPAGLKAHSSVTGLGPCWPASRYRPGGRLLTRAARGRRASSPGGRGVPGA